MLNPQPLPPKQASSQPNKLLAAGLIDSDTAGFAKSGPAAAGQASKASGSPALSSSLRIR
jgi:hypothetical protein